jgi:hypothetical protein
MSSNGRINRGRFTDEDKVYWVSCVHLWPTGKGKVVPVHEGVWGSRCIDPHFLDLGTSWGEWSASRPAERDPDIHWTGGWVGPRAGLDDLEKRKFLILPGFKLWRLGRPARCRSTFFNSNKCIYYWYCYQYHVYLTSSISAHFLTLCFYF